MAVSIAVATQDGRLRIIVVADLADLPHGQAFPAALYLIRQAAEALAADCPVMLPPGHCDPAHHVGLVADLAIASIRIHYSQESRLRQELGFHGHHPSFRRWQAGGSGREGGRPPTSWRASGELSEALAMPRRDAEPLRRREMRGLARA